MPHLHISGFNEIEFPSAIDGVSFNFIADNINQKEERLIAVNYKDNDFFLLVKNEENRHLLKTDKLTRPATVSDAHKALMAYAKLANLEILSSNVLENSESAHLQNVSALKTIDYFVENFPTDKPIRIEVGFGSGRHLLHQAINNPDILFIGIEIHRQSIEQVLKQIGIQKIQNLLILDYDARLFLEFVPSNIVDKIYVHFPVPWDKKPHRRVISPLFVNESMRVLRVGGKLELRTDSENYYAYSYETFISFNQISLEINKNRDIAISSKYEDRWKKMEKNFYDITMTNSIESESLLFDGDFSFDTKISTQNLPKLYKQLERFESGFLNFERAYSLKNGTMFRVAMGSYDKPEHLYVVVEDGSARYFPSNPLKSKSNLLAHRFLNKVLNG